ncbi:MAG: class I SAM-dependent methyltransferase [Eubacteriales bacterium]|nr:class I SAM-dependent methyltransferase [Eubacteriales bacterium]
MHTDNYQMLASCYDDLQQDINYSAWADFIYTLDLKHTRRTGLGDGREGHPLLLDLGCGTGSFCLQIEKKGYDVIGIDRSAAMLNQAREKALAANSAALFLLQDISRFELFGTVDLAVCLLDTLNHLSRPADVSRVFKLLANYLNPGSLFIVDVGTKRHFEKTLGNQIFYQDSGDLTLYWVNTYRPKSQLSHSSLTWFHRKPRLEQSTDDLWERYDEEVIERYYDHQFLLGAAHFAGLDYVGRTAELIDKAPSANAERHFYIFRRRTIES